MSKRVQFGSLGYPENEVRKSGIGNQLPVSHKAAKPGLVCQIAFLHEREFTAPGARQFP